MAFFTRLLFSLIGVAFTVVFAAAVLCWLLVYVVFACLRWMVTGQKPQVLMMWQQIQTMRKGMQSGQWHPAQGSKPRSGNASDVIEDVEVREIHHPRQLPKD
jgi:hypothetical protein